MIYFEYHLDLTYEDSNELEDDPEIDWGQAVGDEEW
jgi:hypothetical protein